MQKLANDVNVGNTHYGKFFIVTANIDLSGIANWTPIGKGNSSSFTGTFGGDNHIISNLTITGESNNVGLFGYVSGGMIKNITLTDANISNNTSVGGIVGNSNSGTIENCAVSGNIEKVGGFVGDNKGTLNITDSLVASNVISASQSAVTFANGDGVCNIENSYYARTIDTVQGNELCVVSNLPEGITAEVLSGEEIVYNGTTYYKPSTTIKLTITNDFKYAPDTLTFSAGDNEFVKNDDGTYTLTLKESADISFDAQFKIGNLEYDAENGYFKIKTVADLQELAAYVNDGHKCMNLTFKLMNDIDVSSATDWVR